MKPQNRPYQKCPPPGMHQTLLTLDPPVPLEAIPQSNVEKCTRLLTELFLAVTHCGNMEGGGDEQ